MFGILCLDILNKIRSERQINYCHNKHSEFQSQDSIMQRNVIS